MAESATRVIEMNMDVLVAALSRLAGPALVLDADLKVLARTPGAEQLVGTPVPTGVSATALLCGMGPERPLAEALAEGRASSARVERVGAGGSTTMLRVRATPLEHGGRRTGWLLLLEGEQPGGDARLEAGGFVTRDATMRRLLEAARRAAASDAPVLLGGEHGSGRTLLARYIHDQSRHSDGPLCQLDCTMRPATRLEGELFGDDDNPGQLDLARGGTLVFHELAALPVELQGRLLEVLRADRGEGAARLVSATSRPLAREVERERFSAELMYRLRVVPLFVPALRERPGDIELIGHELVARHNERSTRQISSIAPAALDALKAFSWPGNVRELDNAIEYAFVMGDGPVLAETELPPEVRGEGRGRSVPTNIPPDAAAQLPNEARRILRALERAGGNRERAAASLGMSRVTLWRKLKAFELEDAVQSGRRQRH